MPEPTVVATFDDLTPQGKRLVYWGYLWRMVLATIGSTIGGAILGGILGFIIGAAGHILGFSTSGIMLSIRIIGVLVGVVWGLFVLWWLLSWFFRSQFGPYSIRFVRTSADVAA